MAGLEESSEHTPLAEVADLAERRRGGSVTIYDVAESAGVHPSTVSRAFSSPGRVSARTELRIREVAKELGFRFNPMARALPSGKTHTLGLVVADITNPMVFDIIRGAERASRASGYKLIVAESQESGEEESEVIERVMPAVDGLILGTTRLSDARLQELAARKRLALINRALPGVQSILPDIDAGISELVDHLAELGHERIAFLAGPEFSWISSARLESLRRSGARHGMEVVEVGPNLPTVEVGRLLAKRALATRATAVVAFNDLLAIGLVQAVELRGVQVPGDLSVIGFDDIFGCELMNPPLTSVRSQLESAGASAAEHLLDPAGWLANAERIHTELIVRGTTGPAPLR